jgi:multidrug efflux pump subunit AcrA (membrane-fusion protein)
MNDVQLALLIAGLVIILVLIIYNWSELKTLSKKQASLTKPKNSINEENDPLFIIEAMKMESTVTAPFDGKVKKVHLKSGVMVEQDDLVVEFE